jgi:hypothetical protein
MIRSLSEILAEVDTPIGRQRLAAYLESLPYPHDEPCPDRLEFLIRIEADGSRMVGRFQNRVITPVAAECGSPSQPGHPPDAG